MGSARLDRAQREHTCIADTIALAIGIAPFVVLVAWVNDYLYGSPLRSGYGALSPGFNPQHATTNIVRYPMWWLESQVPLAFLT